MLSSGIGKMDHLVGMGAPFSPLAFFGVGDTEMLVIMAAILIFFGGKRMPEMAKGLGKLLREFKRATGEVEREFKKVMEEAENLTPTYTPYTPAEHSLPVAPYPAAPALLNSGDVGPAPAGEIPAGAATAPAEASPGILSPAAPTLAEAKPEPKRPPEDHEYHSDV
jgi:TatA/E family protein of Tat protein translocase